MAVGLPTALMSFVEPAIRAAFGNGPR